MKFSYKNFVKKIEEHALYFDDLSRFDNYLTSISDKKIFLKNLKTEMIHFKEMISDFNIETMFKLKFKKDTTYYYCDLIYNDRIEKIISKLEELLYTIDDDNLLIESNRIVYGAEDTMNFHIGIEIEYNNFNRIHITEDLPYSLRGLGIGKMLYKHIITNRNPNNTIRWISSNSIDASDNSKMVWDSLSSDNNLYTCIRDNSIICFDSKLDKNILENIIRKWVNGSDKYVLDSDMLKKYPDFYI